MNKEVLELNKLTKSELSTYFPLPGQVLIEFPKIEEKTKSGLIKGKSVIEEEKNDKLKGYLKIAKLGLPDEFVKEGDYVAIGRILLEHNQYHPMTFDGKHYGQFRVTDIIGIYKFV